MFGLALQNLFDKIVNDVPVVSRESMYECGNILSPPHRNCRQLKPCNPTFGSGLQ